MLPAVAAGFMLRSSGAGRAIGVGLLGLWLLLLFFVGRRLMGARRAPSREAGGGE